MEWIRHRHVIGLLEAGTEQADPYIAMELAPGGTLQGRLQQVERFSAAEASSSSRLSPTRRPS